MAVLFLLLAGVQEIRDISYYGGRDYHPQKHKLDLFLPPAEGPFPVVMWIHGGGWTTGDRVLYAPIGRRFAEQGIGCAVISYRLSPRVRHPEHARDCARAFAWLYRGIRSYGGDPARLFIAGHSAGGHLGALLALDRSYLQEHGIPRDAVKGVIPVSAPLRLPLPSERTWLNRPLFRRAFGTDPVTSRRASPLTHLTDDAPPMLVITESVDSLGIRAMVAPFRDAVRDRKIKGIEFVEAEDRAHISIVLGMMLRNDPISRRVVDFVRKR